MVSWNNLDTLSSYKELADVKPACLTEVMSGDNGAERVKNYSIPMAAGLSYNYASKQVDENVLAALEKLADEAQLADKFKALYNGEVVNTGEKRLVLHHMTRGQLGDAVEDFTRHSRKELQNLLTRCITVRLPMQPARSSQLLFRLVSVEATSVLVQCT